MQTHPSLQCFPYCINQGPCRNKMAYPDNVTEENLKEELFTEVWAVKGNQQGVGGQAPWGQKRSFRGLRGCPTAALSPIEALPNSGVYTCVPVRVTSLPTSFSSCPLEFPTCASHWANWKPPGPQSRVGEGEGGSADGDYLVSPIVSLDSHNSPIRMVVAIDISV